MKQDKTYQWTDGMGLLNLELPQLAVGDCSQPGPRDKDVARWRKSLAARLNELDPAVVRGVLGEYGAWDEQALSDHEENLHRLLWIACCDCAENPNWYAASTKAAQ